jgi:hypothetical protein
MNIEISLPQEIRDLLLDERYSLASIDIGANGEASVSIRDAVEGRIDGIHRYVDADEIKVAIDGVDFPHPVPSFGN